MCGQAENQQKQRHTIQTTMTMPQQETMQQERAALSKAEKKTLKRQQREQERQRRRQAEEQRRQEAERAEALKQRAKEMTEKSGVTRGVSSEDWARHGGASYHYTLRTEDAQRIIEASNGCIYAKPVAEGLVELRPTLPEVVRINGKEIPFRKSYNLMMKVIARNILGENGTVLPGAMEFVANLSEAMAASDLKKLSVEMRNKLFPGVQELYPEETQAEEAYQNMYAMIQGMAFMVQDTVMSYGLPTEILGSLINFAEDVQRMDATDITVTRERLRQQLQPEVDSGTMRLEEMQEALDTISIPEFL